MRKLLIVEVDCEDELCGDCHCLDTLDAPDNYCNLYHTESLTLSRVVDGKRILTCLQSDVDRELLRWSKEDIEKAKKKSAELSEFLGINK